MAWNPQRNNEKGRAYQLDHIFIPKHQLCQTMNVKRKFDRAHSDHAAPCIDFCLSTSPLLKKKQDSPIAHKPNMKLNNTVLRREGLSEFKKNGERFL